MTSFVTFDGPPKYHLYGTNPDGVTGRIGGYETMTDVQAKVDTFKGNPGWVFTVWQATGWKEVSLK